MSKPVTLADIERAHRLFSNHTAMEILDTLGRGESLSSDAPSADQQAISNAVSLLDQMGLVDPGPEPSIRPAFQAVELTPRGRSLVDLLEDISQQTT
jgi:DNA-binding HxlR family transcriptional regulator